MILVMMIIIMMVMIMWYYTIKNYMIIKRRMPGLKQGLTLTFLARGPKRYFDKEIVVKNRISG